MEYGLIGEKLTHSFSAEVHYMIGGYCYELKELDKSELEVFIKDKRFRGINVTIPYKKAVMPYLDYISDEALRIGAVNTIINKSGKLYGYNTDIDGIKALISRVGGVSGEKVLVLGTGGTSNTALFAAKQMGALAVYKVSRTEQSGALSYENAVKFQSDASVIINTTPCGMHPYIDSSAIDISAFKHLKSVVDVVYNPLRTKLVIDANALGVKAEGGLYMLVKQATSASALFSGTDCVSNFTDRIYNKLLCSKENIVLTGMPSAGKSTVGAIVAENLGRPFYDTDEYIVSKTGMAIRDIFEQYGESQFRLIEAEAIKELSAKSACVISTGGGAVLRSENVKILKQNGRIYFLDRKIEQLLASESRPLSRTEEDMKKLYNLRYEIYKTTADCCIEANGNAKETALEIERRHLC